VSEKFNVDLSIQSILTILREGEVTRKSPQNYKEIKKVVMETIKTKISKENLTNYINHSYNLHKKYH